MTSGGTRKTGDGSTVSFFVREPGAAWSEADWDAAEHPDKQQPWSAPRSTVPNRLLPTERFESIGEFRRSVSFDRQEQAKSGQVIAPGRLQRAANMLSAAAKGLVPHGWKYDQKPERDGTYSIHLSRLDVSVVSKNVAGTQVSLPTREVELYELDRRTRVRAGMNIPDEVKRIYAHSPETGVITKLRKIGNVERVGVVNCHELGRNFLLYRSETARPGVSGKRQLMVFAAGRGWLGKMDQRRGVAYTYFAPHEATALMPSSPAQVPLHATYSTHSRGRVTTRHGQHDGGDGSIHGTEKNLLLAKFGSPVHGVAGKASRTDRALNNPNEGAAWAAHDHDMDVLVLRRDMLQFFSFGASLSGVHSELDEAGLGDAYDEIIMCAGRSRPPFGAVHSLADNLVRP